MKQWFSCCLFSALAMLLFMPVFCQADTPLSSGLAVGKRPGPYTSVVSVGAERGTSHCYICEAEDRPVIIIFARSLSDPLAKLVQKIDEAVAKNKDREMRAWVTFLHEDQTEFDPKVVAWAKKHAIRNVPLGIYSDAFGPPTYLLSKEADVTVLLSIDEQVQANFAFRNGELNDETLAQIVQTLPKITKRPN